LNGSPVTFAIQAERAAKRVSYAGFYGPIVGFVVNYSPDRAVQFDLDGKPLETLSKAYGPVGIQIVVGHRVKSIL
jgi:hypothetical protein